MNAKAVNMSESVKECPDASRKDFDSPSASVRRLRFVEPDGLVGTDNYNATIYIGVGSAVDQPLRAVIWTSFRHGRGQRYGHRPVRPSRGGGQRLSFWPKVPTFRPP